MKDRWLIRTQLGEIKGPVQKVQLVDLVKNDRLDPQDEICPGNGHWFSIKEEEYLNTYLYGDEPLGFNPVNETPITLADSEEEDASENQDTVYPDQDDLEYPNPGETD